MKYITVKSLEKYHPGYKDRNLIWCKTYFSMINADPEFEMVCEIDKWRFVCFVMLELQAKKPLPADEVYLKRKGFDFKIRKLTLTLDMLRKFINLVTEDSEVRYDSVTQNRVDKEKDKEKDICAEASSAHSPKPKKQPNPELKNVIDHICTTWEAKRGRKYPFVSKHAKLIQYQCNRYEPSGVMALWDLYLKSSIDFAIKTGFSVEGFLTVLPQLSDMGYKSLKQKYEQKQGMKPAGEILKGFPIQDV